jgi:hypothetical protein
MAHEHVNHVRFFSGDGVNMSSAGTDTLLYTPPTGKVLDVKHVIVSFLGDANCVVDIYNDTGSDTADQVFAFTYDYDSGGKTENIIHLKDLSGFTFSKGFQCVGTSSKFNIAVSGILI